MSDCQPTTSAEMPSFDERQSREPAADRMTMATGLPMPRERCCDGHHFMGCTDDPPFTICCWRCPINPSESPEALTEAIHRAR